MDERSTFGELSTGEVHANKNELRFSKNEKAIKFEIGYLTVPIN